MKIIPKRRHRRFFFNVFSKKRGKNLRGKEKIVTFAAANERKADMAQLVEQRIRNAWVPGSSPGIGSNKRNSSVPFFSLIARRN